MTLAGARPSPAGVCSTEGEIREHSRRPKAYGWRGATGPGGHGNVGSACGLRHTCPTWLAPPSLGLLDLGLLNIAALDLSPLPGRPIQCGLLSPAFGRAQQSRCLRL